MFVEAPLFSITGQKFNVILLAAGLGSRLKPATDFIPKALIELGRFRAIDYFIRKYQYIADPLIIAVGYCGDLLENYCRGRYPSLNIRFSREEVKELRGPGRTLLFALDHASSKLPTLVTFCDYLVEDQFTVENDGLGVCRPGAGNGVLGTYKTVASVRDGVIVDLGLNSNVETVRENGFTGIAICHNTKLLKAIAYSAAESRGDEDIDYALEIIRPYLLKRPTFPCAISRIVEFGTEETLNRTREYLNGHHEVHP